MATTDPLNFNYKLSLFFILAMIETWVRSQECDVAIDQRQHCGAVNVNTEADCVGYEFCCYDPYVQPHCYIKKASPLILYIRVFIIQDHLRDHLKTQVDQAFNVIPQDVDNINLDPVSSQHVKLNALLEAFVSQSTLANKLQYPTCPLKIPLCMRTKCGPQGSNKNPNLCYQDPRCCFDPDIAIYRSLFGEGFMANTPACYHGPTSGYYMKLANQLLPWNAFYQKTVVDLFDVTAQNNNYHAVCSLTLALSETVLKSPICGWEGITDLECKLRDCCYNDKNGDCRYPNDRVFSGALNDLNIYPELKAENMDEAQCSPVQNMYTGASNDPGLYRRIPCNRVHKVKSNLNVEENNDWCPRPTCCNNLNLKSAKKLTARNFSIDQMPDLEQVDTEAGKPSHFQTYGHGTSPRANFCPFFFVKHDSLPDLKDRLIGCCKQHACYHIKRFKNDQESRSTLTIDQDLRDLISYSITNNVGADPRSIPTRNTQESASDDDEEEEPPTIDINNEPVEEVNIQQILNHPIEQQEEEEEDDATWEDWSMWSECSKTCGTGIKTKRRSCISDSGVDSTLCAAAGGDTFEATTCALNPCEPAQWTHWSVWSSCQAGCGFGRQFRLRRCVNKQELDVNEKECLEGLTKEARACRGLACAEWSQWSEYGGCNASCNHPGIEVRRRRCMLDGKPTPVCFGAAYEKRPCSVQGCPDEGTCSNPPCLIWTDWTSFVSCSQTCRGGTQTLWRCQMVKGKCLQRTLEYKRLSCNDEIDCI